MPRVAPLQGDFSAGEFSPLMQGRVDIERYRAALAICLNYVPTVQGAITRRPGTKYIAETKTSSKESRLVAFEFSTTQAYVIEFGDQYLRFYRNEGQILSSGSAYEIVSPYGEDDLFDLKFAQSADTLYIVHPDYAPRKLTRSDHTSWTLSTIDFYDGPYLSAVDVLGRGTSTFTWQSDSDGFSSNEGTLSCPTIGIFNSTDVGRGIRVKFSDVWYWGTITAYNTDFSADIEFNAPVDDESTSTEVRLGIWSDTTSYPSCVTFHENRLIFGGSADYPLRFDGSYSGDYERFSPSDSDGTITDSHAISFTLNSNGVNNIRWMESTEKGLIIGTVAAPWLVKSASSESALSPTSVDAKPVSSEGSANIQPINLGKSLLFLQNSRRRLQEVAFHFNFDGFEVTDISVLSEHITGTGIKEIARQQEPQTMGWGVRDDGVLVGSVYARLAEALRVGWHRHILGGYSDAANTHAKVESVAVIPHSDGSREEVWFLVKRYIDGSTKRYVEVMTQFFDDNVEQKDAFFVDCGLTYDDPKTITGITSANPVVVTAAAHGFSDGDKILPSDVVGMKDDDGTSHINGISFLVANKTTNTFELTDLEGNAIDGSSFSDYVSGGKVRKYVTTISGLDHLEGESVSVLADGAVQPNKTVSSGSITLAYAATTAHIGYSYNSDGQLMRLEAGSANGTALGKIRRTHKVGFLLHRSLGLKIGTSFDDLQTLHFQRTDNIMGRAPELFSGVRVETLAADYDFENQICWRQDQPLPSTILAVMPHMVTQDG